MTRLSLIIILLAMNLGTGKAQNGTHDKDVSKIAIWGHVRDAFTKASVRDVKITVMTTDSMVVDTTTAYDITDGRGVYDATYECMVKAVPQKFIIKASHPDYEDCYVNFNMKYVKRNSFFDAKWHYMKRRNKQESSMDKELGEVVVKASKVRFAYHGDTLVFNADAFNVPEGSMLDGLLKQMDGVEVNKDGEIKVNGRKVDYLTLNGKDFFKGKNQIMLENLPYYTVQNIKVFDRSTDASEVVGRDIEQREYVMDVQLKRKYSTGTIVNAEVGGGVANERDVKGNSDMKADRYLGRLFGLRYSDQSRLALVGGINNIGKGTYLGRDDWREREDLSRGVKRNIIGDYMYSSKNGKVTNELYIYSTPWNYDNETRTSSETYFDDHTEYGEDYQRYKINRWYSCIDNTLKMKDVQCAFPYDLTWNLNSMIWDEDDELRKSSGMYGSNPFEGALTVDTINTKGTAGTTHTKAYNVCTHLNGVVKLPWGDHLTFGFRGLIQNDYSDNYAFNRYLFNKSPKDNVNENRYEDYGRKERDLYSWLRYSLNWTNGWSLQFDATYNTVRNDAKRDHYRLDWLGGVYSNMTLDTWQEMLPSSREALQACLNTNTAYELNELQHYVQNIEELQYTKRENGKYTFFRLGFGMQCKWWNVDYTKEGRQKKVDRNDFLLFPNVTYELGLDNMRKHLYLNVMMTQSDPLARDFVDMTDNSDTLAVKTGNPNLKSTTNYKFDSYYEYLGNHDFNTRIALNGKVVRNAMAQGFVQDAKTGARTYCPENVNGNWNVGTEYIIGTALDSLKLFHLNVSTSYGYAQSVDLAGVTSNERSSISTVLSHNASLNTYVRYDKGQFTARIAGSVHWSNYHRKEMPLIDNTNVFRFTYGGDCTYTMPCNLQLSTDMQMSSNRGFADSYMNTDCFLWNAQLSYPLCKGRLVARLLCNDILGQRTNVDYTANGQGRIETWNNSIGRYFMLCVRYKLK